MLEYQGSAKTYREFENRDVTKSEKKLDENLSCSDCLYNDPQRLLEVIVCILDYTSRFRRNHIKTRVNLEAQHSVESQAE